MNNNEEITLNQERVQENKMGVMPVGKLLANMSWPAIFSMTINALYNIVDSIFVAMIGEKALAAVTFVFPIQMLIISLGVGTGVGVNSLIARRLGAKKFEEANLAAEHSMRLALCNWGFFAIFGLFFAKLYMSLYSVDTYIVENGTAYLKIITIMSLFVMVSINTEKILQATGNMLLPMLCSLSGAITNIILDPILIFGIGIAPKMGVTGAAVATIIGQGLNMVLGLIVLFKYNKDYHIRVRGFKFQWQIVKDIYAVGLPSIIMQSIGSVMLFGMNGILAASETAVAVLGAYFRLQSFIFMPIFGLTQGAMPIMGYNYGARNKDRLIRTFKLSLISAACYMAFGMVLFQTLPTQLLMMFSASDNMLAIGIPALRLISLSFLPAAFGIISATIFQATGHGILSLLASVIRQLIGILPLAWILMKVGGLTVVWAAFPMAEVIGFVFSLIMLKLLYSKELMHLGIESVQE